MEKFSVRIGLITEMLGTVCKDPKIYQTYIESKKPEEKTDEAEYLTVEKIEEKGWTGFHMDDQGLFIYEYMIKGFLKHAGNTFKEQLKIKALRSKIDDYVFISPRKIYLGKKIPDGVIERPLRAMTMQGPRISLARSDYVNAGLELTFEIILLDHKEIKPDIIKELLKYGELSGLGQFRNGGYGRFSILEIK